MNTLFKGITAILPDEESGFSAKVCDIAVSDSAVSYTHLDVYKRQAYDASEITLPSK